MLVRYDDAMATIETSWTTYHDLVPVNCPMVYGTKGRHDGGSSRWKGLR